MGIDRCWKCEHSFIQFGLLRCKKKGGRSISAWKNDDCKKYNERKIASYENHVRNERGRI